MTGIALGFPGPGLDQFYRTGEVIGPQSSVGPAPVEGVDAPHSFFVDATNGSAQNSGQEPRAPLTLIQDAIDLTVSGRGDRIYIMPGSYDENLLLTGKDYVHLIGVFTGYGKPDIVPTTGVALDTGDAQGTYCQSLRFASADADTVIQRGNGFTYRDCVFDGDTGQAATEACLRLKGVADDDSYTASEGLLEDCLIRNSNGFGIAYDVGNSAGNQVGSTHNVFRRCRFLDNVAEDVKSVDTSAGGAHSVQDTLWDECYFMSRNKATHIDLDTTNGANNSGNLFTRCFIWDDTIDTTAVKVATANAGLVGCYSLDGVIDGNALD